MRTHLLCALALLCGAEVACAQTTPGYPYNAYYQGYGSTNPMMSGSYGYTGYPQNVRPTGYMAYPQQGYPNYSNYPGYSNNAYYSARYPNYYYYNTAYQRPAANPSNTYTTAEQPGTTIETAPPAQSVSPMVVPDYVPGYTQGPLVGGVAPAGPPGREHFWASTEYLLSVIRKQRLSAPLVTTGDQQDQHAAAIGQPGTAALFGNTIDMGTFSGVQGTIGVFLDESNHLSLEGGGFFTFQNSVKFGRTSDAAGNPIIARPIFDVINNEERSLVDSFPGIAAGTSTVDAQTQFWGSELDLAYHCCVSDKLKVDGLFGFRFLRLSENLELKDSFRPLIDNALTFQGAFVNAPSSLLDDDKFHTANNFYGLQVGGRVHWDEPWFTVGAFGKVALGITDQNVSINGSSTLLSPTGNQMVQGGILALPSNIGNYNRTVFGFVPEMGFNVGVNVTPHLQLTAGYSYLFWAQVVRPGLQIDHSVNSSMIPTSNNFALATGPSRPAFTFFDEAFWIHNFNFGVDFHY